MKELILFLISSLLIVISPYDYFLHVPNIVYNQNDPRAQKIITNDYFPSSYSNKISSRELEITPSNPNLPSLPQTEHTYQGNLNYIKYYFSNLNMNISHNLEGNCGYTSFGMLMSYYDTFWNDDFIENNYSLNQEDTYINNKDDMVVGYESPGVKNINVDYEYYYNLYNLDNIFDETSEQYKTALQNSYIDWYIANYNEGTFLGKLFEMFLYESQYSPFNSNIYLSGPGVNYSLMLEMFSLYLNHLTFDEEITIISSDPFQGDSSIVRSEIKQYLLAGIPLCVGGISYYDKNNNNHFDEDTEQDTLSGHQAVAYFYDIETDIIYGHLGWVREDETEEYYSMANLNEFFNLYIADYFGIDIRNNSSIPHKHSNKYKNINGETHTSICSCLLNSHVHKYIYTSSSTSKHFKKCYCVGIPLLEDHDFYITFKDSKLYKKCMMCLLEVLL